MKPSRHIAASFSVSLLLGVFTKSFYAGATCLAAGVLVDFDHIIEYIIHHGWKGMNFRTVYDASEQSALRENEIGFNRLFLIFHSGEAAIIAWILGIAVKNIYILAFALGYTLHLILDCLGNPMYPSSYFLLVRIAK